MLAEIRACAKSGESFAFETTLSGLAYLRHINEWKKQGYHVSLFFLSLPSVEAAINRVAERVKQGGHNIPEPIIRRRFSVGRRNFEKYYRAQVNAWALYDNSGPEPLMIEWGENT